MRDWRGKSVDETPSRERDLEDLNVLLDKHLAALVDKEVEAFVSMLGDLETGRFELLTEKQRAWVKSRLDKLGVAQYENLVSRGLVSAETKVPTIDLLKRENLPRKPPPRRRGDDE
jgi:hypothetical protein